MFEVNKQTMAITMDQGDTGSFKFHAVKRSGAEWDETDRMLMTVTDPQGAIVMQRLYRLDDQWDLGDGWILIEFHNADTENLSGSYSVEIRFDLVPVWNGTAPTARCVDALTAGVRMTDGGVVRTKIRTTLTVNGVSGKI